MTDHVVERDGRGLGAGRAVPGQAQRADARGVDHAIDARPRAGLEHGACAVHVVTIDLGRIAGPEPVVRRYVEDPRAALERTGDGIRLEDVSAEHLDGAALERPEAARGAGEDPDTVAVGDEQTRHVGSHEAGGAGDQHVHGGATPAVQLTPAPIGYYMSRAGGTGSRQ